MIKMTDREKDHIRTLISQACDGTPLQPHREFAANYLSLIIIGQIENWVAIKVALAREDEQGEL